MVNFYLETIAPANRSLIWDITGYIYITINTINGHKYIGQHHWEKPGIDPHYYGSGTLLLRAINKHGKENFRVYILQRCRNKWELNAREIAWILMYDANHSPEFYNITEGGQGINYDRSGENNPMHGKHHSEEARKKISEANTGENNYWYGKQLSEEHKRKISENHPDQSGENNPMYGRTRRKESYVWTPTYRRRKTKNEFSTNQTHRKSNPGNLGPKEARIPSKGNSKNVWCIAIDYFYDM